MPHKEMSNGEGQRREALLPGMDMPWEEAK
jgi:hypothetical protein